MRPIGTPLRIRWPSAATWSSWPCVSRTAAIGPSPASSTSGRSCSTGPPRAEPRGKPTPQSTTIRSPPHETSVMLRPTSPRPPIGITRRARGTDREYRCGRPSAAAARPAGEGRVGPLPCAILARSGVWRSLVARSVRVGEVPSSNLGTPIDVGPRTPRLPSRPGVEGKRPHVRRRLRPAARRSRHRGGPPGAGGDATLRRSSRTPGTTSASASCRRWRCSRRRRPRRSAGCVPDRCTA